MKKKFVTIIVTTLVVAFTAFTPLCLDFQKSGATNNDYTTYAATTFRAYAHCKTCDPRAKHVYCGTSTVSKARAKDAAYKKCKAAGHNKSTCRIVVTVQY